jgi:hypothetical protein
MTGKFMGQITEIGKNIEDLANYEARVKVMDGSEKILASSDPTEVAEWVRAAMERLDALVDEPTRQKIMLNCGYNCSLVNKRPIENARTRRRRFPDEASFLDAEIRKPPSGTRLEREGDFLIQYYTPKSFGRGMRCYCSLLRGLPPEHTASTTYCHCSRGFVQKYWENLLERPVEVELLESAVSGSEECKFRIRI